MKYHVLIVLGVCIGLSSCKNEESDIGSSFFQSHANVVVIDTVTVNMETVYLDSIATSGTGVVLVGAYQDSVSGNKQASSYMQLGAPTIQSISSTAIYDSLCFILKPNKYILGDTTQNFTIAVHPLEGLIAPAANQTSLYNTSSFSYDPAPLGSWTGKIYPSRTDSISIQLSDLLGKNLFSAIVNNPNNLSSDNLFIHNYLKGVALTGDHNRSIFGFTASDSSGFMRLYYHNAQDAKTTLHTDFKITASNLQFNHITDDRSNTPLRDINSQDKAINANATNRESVLQPLSNLAIRLDLPYLQNLQHLGRYVEV